MSVPGPTTPVSALSDELIVWGYRLFLGREPESAQAVESHRGHKTPADFVKALLRCQEFVNRKLTPYPPPPNKWVLAPVLKDTRRIWLNLADNHVSRGCLSDNYEPSETKFLEEHLSPDSVFLDIGANIGWFTLVASTIISKGQIHAFEVRPDTFSYLSQTITENGLQQVATAYNVAVSDRVGELFINFASGSDNPGGAFISDHRVSGYEQHGVKSAPLDDFPLPKVDMIKMDAEGSEPLVLMGAMEMLHQNRPIIMSEISIAGLRNVSRVSASRYIRSLIAIGYDVVSIDARAPGKKLTEMPADWPGNHINVACIPKS